VQYMLSSSPEERGTPSVSKQRHYPYTDGGPTKAERNERYLSDKIRVPYKQRGTRWRSWLRHGATSRKVAGSIPDGVIIHPAALWHWG
jgi:hypothetical protein